VFDGIEKDTFGRTEKGRRLDLKKRKTFGLREKGRSLDLKKKNGVWT
jgi:hypothetical protein